MLYKSSSSRLLALLFLPIILLAKDGIAVQTPGDTSSSRYLQGNITQMYDKNIDNFEKVLKFSSLSKNLNFKADVLIGLYSAMSDVRHFDNPLHAIPMYNELEALINANISDSNREQSDVLEAKRNQLAVIIIEKGAEVLASAVFLKNCKDKAMVKDLFGELYASNKTLSNLTITTMVNKVRWMLPMEKLIESLSSISPTAVQNVDALMALYNEDQFNSTQRETVETRLRQLRLHLENPTLPIGEVCLIEKFSDAPDWNSYLQKCRVARNVCIHFNPKSSGHAKRVYIVNVDTKKGTFTFANRYYDMRPPRIIDDQEENDGNMYNDRNSEVFETSIEWKVERRGDHVIMKNEDSTMYLCAGISATVNKMGERLIHTRTLSSYQENPEECKWFVENCSGSE